MPHHCTPGSGRDSRWGSHWLTAQGGEIERVEDEQAPGSSPDKRKPKRKVAPEAAAPESSAGDFQEPPVIKRKVGSPPARLPACLPLRRCSRACRAAGPATCGPRAVTLRRTPSLWQAKAPAPAEGGEKKKKAKRKADAGAPPAGTALPKSKKARLTGAPPAGLPATRCGCRPTAKGLAR